jgi:hypothetical protein
LRRLADASVTVNAVPALLRFFFFFFFFNIRAGTSSFKKRSVCVRVRFDFLRRISFAFTREREG